MRKAIFLFFIYISGISCFAQLNKIENVDIPINDKENVHLIFNSNIKYLNNSNNSVGCDRPVGTSNIVRIRAKNKHIKQTTISVGTADGKFYSYLINYKDILSQSSYFIGVDKDLEPEKIDIDTVNPIHLIFSEPLIYIDRGLREVALHRDDSIRNIVKVTALEKFEGKTNISAATANNFYTYDLVYSETEHSFTYYIGEEGKEKIILDNTELTDQEKQNIIKQIKKKGRKIHHLGFNKNKIEFSIQNIFVRGNKIIFRFCIDNKSNIKYDARNMLFEITEAKVAKRTTSQENDKEPLFIDNGGNDFFVSGKTKGSFIVCFEKFSIPDAKVFHIYIDEDGGGRLIDYNLKNDDLINAEIL